MQLTSFQPPELRDAQNNIIQEGTYSVKNGVLANAQNTGVLDYINNNLQALQNNVVSLQSSSLIWEYVDQLPTPSEANPNAIYAVLQTDEQGNRYYIEYRLINGTWQVFGSTKVDITQAVMKADVLDSIRADSMLPVQSKAILNALNEKPNVDDVYSKAETNTLLNNKANGSDLDNYLLKSGGTVSGTLTIGNSISFNSAMSELNKNANNGYLLLRGGTTYNDSANLLLYGNDRTENAGRAILRAGNGSTQIYVDSNGTFAPTPATTDNSTKIATTAYVKSNLANYLPLSGGTINGILATTGAIKPNVIDFPVGQHQISVGQYNAGADLVLLDKDASNNAGRFYLRASIGNGSSALMGDASGKLTWVAKDVSVIDSIGTGYIRYTNGLQICWTYNNVLNTDASGYSSWTYPVAFNAAPAVLVGEIERMSYHNLSVWSTTGTKADLALRNMSAKTMVVNSSFNLCAIAIGWWK